MIAGAGCTTQTTSATQTIGGITIPTTTGPPTAAEARQIAAAAYVWGYPLVVMDLTKDRQTATSAPTADGSAAPVNQFAKSSKLLNASFTAVVAPSVDTLYSFAWLDLTKEPMVLSVPNTTGRYYLMGMLDGWTNVFASPGTRTSGTDARNFAIVGPGWNGTLPAGLTKIQSPTEMAWILGRTQANGPADLPAAIAVQDQYKLTPLSAWRTNYTPPTNVAVNPNVDTKTPPVFSAANMTPATFYGKMAALMVANPPSAADKPVVDQLARISIVPGSPFDWNGLNATMQDAIVKGAKDGLAYAEIPAFAGSVNVNGWSYSYNLGTYGTDYTTRARVACAGIGANVAADALNPSSSNDSTGATYSGTYKYVMHFAKNGTPPVNAFWSLTMYNNQHFLVANPVNRYAISPHLGPLKYNSDGSLDIYIQNTSPGPDKESNWLPAPPGGFILMLRMIWPQEAALNGSWVPPAVQRVG